MLVQVFNDDGQQTENIEAVRLDGPINSVNLYHLYMSSAAAEELFSWAYEFEINGERYTSNSAHHDLQQEDGSQIRKVILSKV